MAPHIPFQADDDNEPTEAEASLEDSLNIKLVEHEKRKRILRRSTKALPAMANLHDETPLDSKKLSQDESSIDSDDITPQIEKLKMNRKSVGNKNAFLSALDKIRRAPTPLKSTSVQG